jgi:cell filamentation protein
MQEYEYYYEGVEFYCYPNTKILVNKFGLKDSEKLEEIERRITFAKTAEYEKKPLKGKFDFEHFCAIHNFLFCDIYEWAGKIRDGEFMFKGDSMFFRACYIEQGFNDFYRKLQKEDLLQGLSKPEFCKRLAYFMGELDAIHPFREGNGRTSRLYFKQLAQNAGYGLEFSKVTKEALLEADIAAFNCDYSLLVGVLGETISKL